MNKPVSKTSATLGSRNFFVSIISLIMFTVSQLAGAQIPEGASEQLLDAINAQDLAMIFTIAVPNLVNPILKIVKDKLFTWKIFKSVNFVTQAATVLLLGLAGFGLMFPEGAAANVVEAIFGGDTGVMISAIVINVVNPLYHFIFDNKKDETIKNEKVA